ncbi:hypothetical protein HPB48_012592 [Haemaphysalis longicornis]|uniref:RNase H type-1 domain-containing protein n=1 Tax=Haemaphysalis longicornis TaxID=44386 RepID=A0A9J6GII4_HAELO|nr:hypothetical protein HPB48_012592 [Haemaphysalis longicornis]
MCGTSDASDYREKSAMCIGATNYPGNQHVAGTIVTTHTVEAEDAAIALAISSIQTLGVLVSDSRAAITNFTRGRISPKTLAILRHLTNMENLPTVTLLWVPIHDTLEGNEEAYEFAGALTNQTNLPVAYTDTPRNGGRLLTYRKIELL